MGYRNTGFLAGFDPYLDCEHQVEKFSSSNRHFGLSEWQNHSNNIYDDIKGFIELHVAISIHEKDKETDCNLWLYLPNQPRSIDVPHMNLDRNWWQPPSHCILKLLCHKPWCWRTTNSKTDVSIWMELYKVKICQQQEKSMLRPTLLPLLRCRIAPDICTCTSKHGKEWVSIIISRTSGINDFHIDRTVNTSWSKAKTTTTTIE